MGLIGDSAKPVRTARNSDAMTRYPLQRGNSFTRSVATPVRTSPIVNTSNPAGKASQANQERSAAAPGWPGTAATVVITIAANLMRPSLDVPADCGLRNNRTAKKVRIIGTIIVTSSTQVGSGMTTETAP